MSWVLVVIVHMGTLRPPIEYRYPMPDFNTCFDAIRLSEIKGAEEGRPVVIFCAQEPRQ